MQSSDQINGGIALLGHKIVKVNRAKRDSEGAGKKKASKKSSGHKDYHAPCPCLSKLREKRILQWSSNVSLLSKIAAVHAMNWSETLRDHWLDGMKPSTSRCNILGGIPACWAWVPLKH